MTTSSDFRAGLGSVVPCGAGPLISVCFLFFLKGVGEGPCRRGGEMYLLLKSGIWGRVDPALWDVLRVAEEPEAKATKHFSQISVLK